MVSWNSTLITFSPNEAVAFINEFFLMQIFLGPQLLGPQHSITDKWLIVNTFFSGAAQRYHHFGCL